jgi:hypothetical protein
VEVIRWGAIPVNPVGPLLLQGNSKNGHAAGFVSHHVQKIMNGGAFLNIVRQVEMGIVEFIIAGLRASRRNDDERHEPGDPANK